LIPNDEQLETISHMQGGSLEETPFAVLLHALTVFERTVVLEIERGPLEKSIFFENGAVVDCRSNLLHDTLSGFMVARGDITEEVAQDCLNKSVSRGIRFGEALILEGLITASELYRALQQNLAKKLLDGFSWRTGEFRMREHATAVESPLKVNTPQLVLTGISRFALDAEVNEAVGPLVGKTLYLNPDPPYALSEIRLSANQRQLTRLLENGRRIDELAAETSIAFNEIMRLLYSLAVLGVVIPEDRLPQRRPGTAAAEGGAPPEVEVEAEPAAAAREPHVETPDLGRELATRALPPGQLEALRLEAAVPAEAITDKARDGLMDAYLKHRGRDAFELLGADEDASMTAIESRFLEFSERFAPWKFAAAGLEGLAEKAEDLFLAGGRAFGELCDVERRNALILRRRNLREEQAKKTAPDRFLIKSDLLDPEVQFKKGKSLMQGGHYREALSQLEFALDCDPQNSLYRAELAHCRFLESDGRKADEALNELREVLRIDPECGLAFYLTGLIQSEVGDPEIAEGNLRRAIKMMMPDRRPIEALKALEGKKKRKRKLF